MKKRAKRVIALLLGLIMTVSIAVPSSATGTSSVTEPSSVTDVFKDVEDGAWYVESVQYVYDQGIMSGSNGVFSPNKPVTRAMVITTFYNIEGAPEVTNTAAFEQLSDVSAGLWYADAVCWAFENGITSGNGRTKAFNGDAAVTREQLATFFFNYAEFKDLSTTQREDLSSFLNGDQVSDYAKDAVEWAVGADLINGVPVKGKAGNVQYDLAPKSGATRAQLATILKSFCEQYELLEEEKEDIDIIIDGPGITKEAAGDVSITPRYFPVTMYNYDGDAMNAVTRQIEFEQFAKNGGTLDEWKGMYFTEGDRITANYNFTSHMNTYKTYEKVEGSALEMGASYILVSNFANETHAVGAYVSGGRFNPAEEVNLNNSTLAESAVANALVWTYDSEGRLYHTKDGINYYINVVSCGNNGHTSDAHGIELTTDASTAAKVQTTSNQDSTGTPGIFYVYDSNSCGNNTGAYLNMVDNASDQQFGAWYDGDNGSKFRFYKQITNIDFENSNMPTQAYKKVTGTTWETGASYIFVSNNNNSAVGDIVTVEETTRFSGNQVVSGDSLWVGSRSEETIVWQIDAEDHPYCIKDGMNYYINIIEDCADDATHRSKRHSVELTTDVSKAAKLTTDSNDDSAEAAGTFFIYDAGEIQESNEYIKNLALGKTANASADESTARAAASAVDGDLGTRWSANTLGESGEWLKVDLGTESVITSFRVAAEDAADQKIKQFKIEGSNDDVTYTEIYQAPENAEGYDLDYTVELTDAVSYRYIKITIQSLIDGAYASASLREFGVYGYVLDKELALNKTATAIGSTNGEEPERAVNGDTTNWWYKKGYEAGDWLQVDLGSERKAITGFRLVAETNTTYNQNFGEYRIEGSNDGVDYEVIYESADLSDTVGEGGKKGFPTDHSFVLEEAVSYRYIKIIIEKMVVPDENLNRVWDGISIAEFEVHGTDYVENEYINSGAYLNMADGALRQFRGWFNGGPVSGFKIYKCEEAEILETGSLGIADYNLWTGFVPWDPTQADNPLGGSLTAAGTIGSNPGEAANQKKGNRLYNHLVKSTLDANNNIQFNVPEPGIFSLEETDYRQVYTNVEMPFQYDLDNGVYTFDSSKMSARFKNGTGQDNSTLEYATTPQASDKTYGDGSSTMWMPYNDVNSLANVTKDYHFGMTFSIPFFMTEDGKLPGGAYKDIEFNFSGDDDIWVFIDGQLVLDMGGIHNNLHGNINFATNTWRLYRNPDTNNKDQELSYIDGAATSGTLFATAENTHDGIISMTREAFAQTEVHTLTIFYLERGSGSSNNMISFNLPMRDSVNVMKEVSATDKQGNTLSNEMLSYINQRDFKFKLTNNGKAVEKNYYLMDIRGIYLQTLKTNEDGEFTLKNGQTAKFVGPLTTGDNYVVTEMEDEATTAWKEPDWYSISRLGEPITEVKETTDEQWSCEPVEIAEAFPQYMESVNIRCTNTLDLDGEPEINDDRIVIDYGLPVEIDVFKNDIVPVSVELDFDNVSLSNDGVGTFGTAVYDSATRKIKYTLTEQLTTAEKFVYTVPYTNDAGKSGEVSATLWIMPATSMYYEEDFSDLVTYTGNWSALGTATNALQEPGVVGTLSDSTYGSDAAYLDDSNDSNGTSKYVKTTAENGAGFSYTFTGTGTTFFARTTNNSGYMKVDIECIDSDTTTTYIDQWRRDTSYKTDDADTTLYNIPVFSWTAEEYGTYKVTVSLAKYVTNPKTGKQLYGTEFWLDGIKVFEPSDPSAADAAAVNSAYAADGEANVDVVTLRNKLIQNQMIYDEATQSYTWSEQDKENGNFVVFTDFKKTEDGQSYEAGSQEIILAEDYISRGPKEEVYLQSGQSVSFMLKDWDPNGAHVYLGIKAPMGAGTVLVNGNELSINNSVDAYYDISNYRDVTTHADGTENAKFVITAGADSLISLTNIKATGGTEYTILSPVGTPDESAVEPMNEDIHVNGAEGADPLPGTNATL